MEKHICPVCGKYYFEEVDDLDTCPFCGWLNDYLAELSPDSLNFMGLSLNHCKEMYDKDPDWLSK